MHRERVVKQMARLLSEKDFELLGYRAADRICEDPGFTVFEAVATAGLDTVKARFCYLKSGSSYDDAERSRRFLGDRNYVVIPQGMADRRAKYAEMFGSKASCYLYEDLGIVSKG